MVPGSTLRYGSSFCMVTRRPRALSRRPRLEAVSPLPRLEATPPVTKRCLVDAGRDEYDATAKGALPWSVRKRRSRRSTGHQDIRWLPSEAAATPTMIVGGCQPRPTLSRSLGGRVRAGFAFCLPDRPPLRGGQPLLVRFAEPGQCHGTDDGKAEPKHGH